MVLLKGNVALAHESETVRLEKVNLESSLVESSASGVMSVTLRLSSTVANSCYNVL